MNKVALITGAAKRVGACIARTLHANDYVIALHHHTSAEAARELSLDLNRRRSESCVAVAADLMDPEACAAVVARTVDAFGGLDLLVNNASVYAATPLADLDEQDFAATMAVNLRAPLLLAKHAAPLLRERRGAIVNITDIYADRPTEAHPIYVASKAGLAALTKSLALDLAPAVRVNAVAPGAILWPEDGDIERRERILARIPAARPGTAEDVANAVAYLAGAAYVTGETIAVDGGRSLTI